MQGLGQLLLLVVVGLSAADAASRRKIVQSRISLEYQPPPQSRSNQFDWNLIKDVLGTETGNVVISPLSAKIVLSLLSEGAALKSETQRELASVLGTPKDDQQQLHDDLQRYADQYKDLSIASRIFADESITLVQKYLSIVAANYNTTVEQLAMANGVETAKHINGWIAENTRGLIEDAISSASVKNALLLLVNTVYFKGSWTIPFPPNATTVRPFYPANGKPQDGSFMKQREQVYRYRKSEKLKARFLRLPYDNNLLSMIAVLPDEGTDMNGLLQRLSGDAMHQVLNDMEEEEVEIELPKFSIRHAQSLRENLQRLGLRRVFSENAELPLISRGGSTAVMVKDTFQKSCIAVDERGTEASAATDAGLVFTILSEPEQFIANRPFLFFIMDEVTGNLLFAGKLESLEV